MFRLRAFIQGLLILISLYTGSLLAIIPQAPEMSAKAYILMDADTGQILVSKNADLQLPPSSLTKMMTSYVLSDEVA